MNSQSDRVTLGRTDLRVSALGIGTWAWGDRIFWGYGGGYDETHLQEAFRATLDAGVNLFDTAEIYGFHASEKLLGRFMREANARASLVIATKFFPMPWRLRRKDLLAALRGSVRRLQVEQVDLYQMHWPSPLSSIQKQADALGDAVESGLARTVGVSNYSLPQMARAYEALERRAIALASNQVDYSLLDRAPERSGLLDACHELGVTLIAYSPLAQGVLTGKYTPENPLRGPRAARYTREFLLRVQPLIELLKTVGQAHGGKTPSQVALNWTMCKGTVPIPGVKTEQQARDNTGALGWRLTEAEMRQLDQASAPFS